MEFRIADTFTDALAKLPSQEQKAAKTTAFDLQLNPSARGLQFHRIDKSKDPNFWSIRVNRDLRIVVHKTASSFLLCYVDHHDKAYDWAVRRRIEAHPRTGAIQIVEVRERVEIAPPAPVSVKAPVEEAPPAGPPLFETLSPNELLSIGVPQDWIPDIRSASEDRFFDLVSHIPREAAEALLEYAATGNLATVSNVVSQLSLPPLTHAAEALSVEPPFVKPARDPFTHPDSLRRFRVIENTEELRRALEFPWEKWAVFLHPSQREIIERDFDGPARVAGSAGTGKTVVALHRTARLVQGNRDARVLLTTFSRPLANMLEQKLKILIGEDSSVIPRVVVTPFRGDRRGTLSACIWASAAYPTRRACTQRSFQGGRRERRNRVHGALPVFRMDLRGGRLAGRQCRGLCQRSAPRAKKPHGCKATGAALARIRCRTRDDQRTRLSHVGANLRRGDGLLFQAGAQTVPPYCC